MQNELIRPNKLELGSLWTWIEGALKWKCDKSFKHTTAGTGTKQE